MARIGEKRVDEVLDYERDIKGKRLVRLRAGVGAGKNYWVRHLPEKYPDLQILLITSRKNTAAAEAFRLGTDCKIHFGELFDINDRDWMEDYPANLVICTNGYIEHFFKTLYKKEDPRTHLWNKFDVIFVDEAHSLTADASFADSPFYVERFIYHTMRFNHQCDIVLMTGTPEPIDWLFEQEAYSEHTNIDLYDQCIHLVPSIVLLVPKIDVPRRVHLIWSMGKRQIYFVNSVKNMVRLIDDLKRRGIPENDIGIAYTESENEGSLPTALVAQRSELRRQIVETSKLPQEVKIFITTTQNKEGINIEDDDIRFMFSESHQKSELEQMAGRVRGNPETGRGLSALMVVHDAAPHPTKESYINRELDQFLLGQIKSVLEQHKKELTEAGKTYSATDDIKAVSAKCPYLRYDYITSEFSFFTARDKASQQARINESEFIAYVENFEDVYYEYVDARTGESHIVSGASELREKWFPYSKLFLAVDETTPVKEATEELLLFLEANNLFEAEFHQNREVMVTGKIRQLIEKYGAKTLSFGRGLPKTLNPALKRFGLTVRDVSHTQRMITYKLPKGEELGEEP